MTGYEKEEWLRKANAVLLLETASKYGMTRKDIWEAYNLIDNFQFDVGESKVHCRNPFQQEMEKAQCEIKAINDILKCAQKDLEKARKVNRRISLSALIVAACAFGVALVRLVLLLI